MTLSLAPTFLAEANAFVKQHHRHHRPVVGHLFSLACACEGLGVVGVAIVGRPVARNLQDGWTAEVTRVAVDSKALEEVSAAHVAGALFRARERGAAGLTYAEWGLRALRKSPWGAVNSFLYGACWRAAQCLGYRRLVTYTLPEEGGASLRAANWICLGEAGGGSWNVPSRPRVDKHPTQIKMRWEAA